MAHPIQSSKGQDFFAALGQTSPMPMPPKNEGFSLAYAFFRRGCDLVDKLKPIAEAKHRDDSQNRLPGSLIALLAFAQKESVNLSECLQQGDEEGFGERLTTLENMFHVVAPLLFMAEVEGIVEKRNTTVLPFNLKEDDNDLEAMVAALSQVSMEDDTRAGPSDGMKEI